MSSFEMKATPDCFRLFYQKFLLFKEFLHLNFKIKKIKHFLTRVPTQYKRANIFLRQLATYDMDDYLDFLLLTCEKKVLP